MPHPRSAVTGGAGDGAVGRSSPWERCVWWMGSWGLPRACGAVQSWCGVLRKGAEKRGTGQREVKVGFFP